MSEFDKEAEREKLREKYERDQADREATRRMSDLLLKGARMTNTHCGTCGDPLFEQNGVTFCPTCHGSPDGVEASLDEAGSGAQAGTETSGAQAGTETSGAQTGTETNADARAETKPDAETEPASSEGPATAGEPAADAAPTGADGEPTAPADGSTPPESAPEPETRPTDEGEDARSRSDRRERTPQSSESPAAAGEAAPRPTRRSRGRSAPVDGDLESARDALVESLEYFAREAARTDDPRYATECLGAAREAAATLEYLR